MKSCSFCILCLVLVLFGAFGEKPAADVKCPISSTNPATLHDEGVRLVSERRYAEARKCFQDANLLRGAPHDKPAPFPHFTAPGTKQSGGEAFRNLHKPQAKAATAAPPVYHASVPPIHHDTKKSQLREMLDSRKTTKASHEQIHPQQTDHHDDHTRPRHPPKHKDSSPSIASSKAAHHKAESPSIKAPHVKDSKAEYQKQSHFGQKGTDTTKKTHRDEKISQMDVVARDAERQHRAVERARAKLEREKEQQKEAHTKNAHN